MSVVVVMGHHDRFQIYNWPTAVMEVPDDIDIKTWDPIMVRMAYRDWAKKNTKPRMTKQGVPYKSGATEPQLDFPDWLKDKYGFKFVKARTI